MAKSESERKTRSDKFPLTLHQTGQFCKKIKGTLYYFGADKQIIAEREVAILSLTPVAEKGYSSGCSASGPLNPSLSDRRLSIT